MAAVTGKKEYADGAKRQIARVVIEFESNGFRVSKEMVPKTSKNGPIWEPSKPADAKVFTEPGTCLDYLEECLGSKEHEAHEKREMAGEKKK